MNAAATYSPIKTVVNVGGGRVVIIIANPDLIKEIQLTVWVAGEYLAAQIPSRLNHRILLLLSTSGELTLNFRDLKTFWET